VAVGVLLLAVAPAAGQDPVTTVEFSGTTVGAPLLALPAFGSDATNCAPTTTPEPYVLQFLAVDSADVYQIKVVEAIDAGGTGDVDDTVLTLYVDDVDTTATGDTCLNLLAIGNVMPGEGLEATLEAQRQYFLVVSGFLGVEDDWTLSITGPPGRSIWLGQLGTGVEGDEATGAGDADASDLDLPYRLGAVYPNPFSATSEFSVEVSEEQDVRVEALDLLGRRIGVVFDGRVPAGAVTVVRIDGSTWTPGVYFVRVVGEAFRETRVVTLVR
jgi:hypothetical protein